MRGFLTSSMRALSVGGFWVAVVLVLPNCTFDPSGLGGGTATNFPKGPEPRSDIIFCDVELVLGRSCPSDAADPRLENGVLFSEAAIALVEGRAESFGLDDSPAARARCAGLPEIVRFQGQFPRGFPVCLNCSAAIGTADVPDVATACRKQCLDFFHTTTTEGDVVVDTAPSPVAIDFCNTHSRPSVSVPVASCFAGGCTSTGIELDGFADPRGTPQPVVWTDLIGVATGAPDGATLTRTAPFTGEFDAGAASLQWIRRGNAFVEFGVTRNHQLGFQSVIGCANPAACPDNNPGLSDITYGLDMGGDNRVYVFVGGVKVNGPDVNGSFGTYVAGERFRVYARDNWNGNATISFARVIGPCMPGTECNKVVFYTDTTASVAYPLRVDGSLQEPGTAFTDVRLVAFWN